jgi:transcription elongation factor Elf1
MTEQAGMMVYEEAAVSVKEIPEGSEAARLRHSDADYTNKFLVDLTFRCPHCGKINDYSIGSEDLSIMDTWQSVGYPGALCHSCDSCDKSYEIRVRWAYGEGISKKEKLEKSEFRVRQAEDYQSYEEEESEGKTTLTIDEAGNIDYWKERAFRAEAKLEVLRVILCEKDCEKQGA